MGGLVEPAKINQAIPIKSKTNKATMKANKNRSPLWLAPFRSLFLTGLAIFLILW